MMKIVWNMCVCVFVLVVLMMIQIGIGENCMELFSIKYHVQPKGTGENVVKGCDINYFIH
jgi:hypothetical protein